MNITADRLARRTWLVASLSLGSGIWDVCNHTGRDAVEVVAMEGAALARIVVGVEREVDRGHGRHQNRIAQGTCHCHAIDVDNLEVVAMQMYGMHYPRLVLHLDRNALTSCD